MANTLKFGNGEWATKEGSTLAYNDEGGNFKPLPFTFDRSTSATRVNKEGLIEVVSNNEPRIDFLNDNDGALLLEPSRSNLNDYSEDGTQWNVLNTTVSLDNSIKKPDGILGVYKQTDDATDGQHRVDVRPTVVNGTEYTFSAFVKKPTGSDIDFVYLLMSGSNFPTTRFYFNIEEGTSLDDGGTIEDYGNGWYRVSGTATANGDGSGIFGVNLTNAYNTNNYSGTGNGSMYVYGIQVESNSSYATSYIPTQGSIGTRAADSCSQTPPSGIIGQTEGTMFIDVDFDTLSDLNMFLSIRPNSSNKIEIYRDGNIIYAETASSNSFNISKTNITVGRHKIAFAYSSGSSAMYINGVLIGSDTTTFAFTSTLDDIYINSRGTSFIEQSNYNEVKIYNTRLSNTELQALTQI